MSNDYNKIVLDSMHELRYFNQRLKNLAESMTKQLNIHQFGQGKPLNVNADNADQIRVMAEGMLDLSQLFRTRLDFIDVELNPDAIGQMEIGSISIYGKFDKARKMLNSAARGRKVKIVIVTEEVIKREIEAYSIIDIMPYMLLDNAVKYSPERNEVNVEFQYYESCTEIKIESFGPWVSDEEIPKIIDKHYRGENALKSEKVVGRGLGLYFVKYICDLHDITIRFSSDTPSVKVGGVPYSIFTVTLSIPWGQ